MIVLGWISGSEIILALVVGLVLFGGRLPEVLKDAGRLFFRLRRSLEEIRRESGLDQTLRELDREARAYKHSLEKEYRLEPPTLDEPAKPWAGADKAGDDDLEDQEGASRTSPGSGPDPAAGGRAVPPARRAPLPPSPPPDPGGPQREDSGPKSEKGES